MNHQRHIIAVLLTVLTCLNPVPPALACGCQGWEYDDKTKSAFEDLLRKRLFRSPWTEMLSEPLGELNIQNEGCHF
jgi:hypothetical protein